MISRVLNEREKAEIAYAIETFEEAIGKLEPALRGTDPVARERARLQKERISQLLELARLGHRLVETLVSTAKLDAEPLVRFLLRASGSSSPSPSSSPH